MPKKEEKEEEKPKADEKPIIRTVKEAIPRKGRTIINRGIDRAAIKEAILKSRKKK